MSEEFSGLTSAFNVDYVKDVPVNLNTENTAITPQQETLQEITKQPIIPDQQFLQTELKTMIMGARTVLHKLEKDIQIGSPARSYEVYARLIESIGQQYQSLLDLHKTISDIENEKNIGKNTSQTKVMMTPEQIADMLDHARKTSSLNAIDATFEIEDERDVKGKKKKKKDEDD